MEKIFRPFVIITLVIFCCTSCSDGYIDYDTSCTITGVVVDRDTGKPIDYATVTISPGAYNTFTGYDGTFEFIHLTATQYKIQVQKSGYRSNYKDITTRSGEVISLAFSMEKEK